MQQTRITLMVFVLPFAGANPAMAAELMPAAGRGSTLTVVGLATLVLAVAVFGVSHWLETRKLRRESGTPDEPAIPAHAAEQIEEPAPRLALVPENPMLDALNAKHASLAAGGSGDSAQTQVPPDDDGQFATAAQ